jgi:hypothetical protein
MGWAANCTCAFVAYMAEQRDLAVHGQATSRYLLPM